MGQFGDKVKKMAAEQTRQLLQNFQQAQSSKTKSGYSYGKLNEDGTATLADGTTVQVEVKGRPGQYAPVFNLGNGQGLVDQPEAKFFNVDSNVKTPWCIKIRERTITRSGGDTAIYTNFLQLTNLESNISYDIPVDWAPDTTGPRTLYADLGFIYHLYVNLFFDFSLDGRHIIMCSSSGDPATLNRSNSGGYTYNSPACDLNFCIVENWRIVDSQLVYDNLKYFKLSADTYSRYSANQPGEFFSTSAIYTDLGGLTYSNADKVTNFPVPIVYTGIQGNAVVDFWIASNSVSIISQFSHIDPDTGRAMYVYTSGSTYKTSYIHDFLGVNTSTTVYDYSVGSANLTQYKLGPDFPEFNLNTSPTVDNPVYVGSYLEGRDLHHIVAKGESILFPSNLRSSTFGTPDQGSSQTTIIVSNYCTMNSDFEITSVPESNSYIPVPLTNVIGPVGGSISFVYVGNSSGPSSSFKVLYDNAVIAPKSNIVRYSDIKSVLETLGIPEIFQTSVYFGRGSSLAPLAVMDVRTYYTYGTSENSPEVTTQVAYLTYILASQYSVDVSVGPDSVLGPVTYKPQMYKFGASKGYSQAITGRVPVLTGNVDATSGDIGTYTLWELVQTESGYDSSKYYTIEVDRNFQPAIAVVYR